MKAVLILIVAGNVISFVGCVLMVLVGFIKKKEHILVAQFGQFTIQTVGNFVLGSVSGGISCIISMIRLLVFKKFKVTVWVKIGFIAGQAALTWLIGADSLITWLPMLSIVAYTWYLDTDNAVVFKIANMVGVVMWVVHDFYFQNYVAFAFDIFTIISTTAGIILILRDKKKVIQ